MSKLQDLVPPMELCKKIPAGAFADSALVWMETRAGRFGVQTRISPEEIPAPTLAEIMAPLPSERYKDDMLFTLIIFDARAKFTTKDWQIGYARTARGGGMDVIDEYKAHDCNAATAALKLWLEMETKEK